MDDNVKAMLFSLLGTCVCAFFFFFGYQLGGARARIYEEDAKFLFSPNYANWPPAPELDTVREVPIMPEAEPDSRPE